jgi:hypothetical protein
VNGKNIVPDAVFAGKYECGGFDQTTGNTIVVSGVAGKPLVNGKTYAVSVAALDSFGNVGELASPICQFPEETTDFWRNYRNAGGGAGGGYCSVREPGGPAGTFALGAVALFFGGSLARRVRRLRREKKSWRSE